MPLGAGWFHLNDLKIHIYQKYMYVSTPIIHIYDYIYVIYTYINVYILKGNSIYLHV